jgi:hypothetical protein
MKNQYFGDVNDFKKYGLLKQLSSDTEAEVAVCWTLTPDDTRSDGSRTGYLDDPGRWRALDPPLFDFVRSEVLEKGVRSVNALEQSDALPSCRYFTAPLDDQLAQRERYFDDFFRFAKGSDLVFFDPDNGLGITAIKRGKRGSSKYIYLCEIERAWVQRHSVLFYQHFPRRPRDAFLGKLVETLGQLPGLREVYFFVTSHVVFVLLPNEGHEPWIAAAVEKFRAQWESVVRVEVRHPSNPTIQSHPRTWERDPISPRSVIESRPP